MKEKLTKSDVRELENLQTHINRIWDKFEKDDIELHYGNGTASSQLSCAYAAIECILQEHRED